MGHPAGTPAGYQPPVTNTPSGVGAGGGGFLNRIGSSSSTGTQFVAPSASMPNMDAFLLGAQLFGTVMQSYGAYQEASAKADALEFNAIVAEMDIEQVEKAKKQELHKARTSQRRLLARQIAATAGSGRQFSGSPLSVMARSESESHRDQEIIRSNAAGAKGRLYSEVAFTKSKAASTRSSGVTRGLSNILIGGSSAYAKSNYFKKSGGR